MGKRVTYNYCPVGRLVGLINNVCQPNRGRELGMSRGRTGRPCRYPGEITLSIARLKALLRMICRATMGPSQVPAAKQKCGLYDDIQMQMPPARRSPPDRAGNMVFVLDSAGLRVEHGGV